MKLLFTCCSWHGLAKLRMHTDQTLDIFDRVTAAIGTELRHFATNTCNAFQTRELRRETTARQRRALKKNADQNGSTLSSADNGQRSGALPKMFNMHTIKNHSLGDYPDQICHYGTTDSYSTESVSTSFCNQFNVQTNLFLSE